MKQIEHFVPGDPVADERVLSRLRRPIPAGVTRSYVEAYTDPGEVVLLPYCQGPVAVREIVGAERRALALNFDPLLVLIVETALLPLPTRELDGAVARLGDSLKQGVPLRRYLADLYATTCPACLRPAVADYFVWDREQGAPVTKYLRCPSCAWDGQAAVDREDLERLDKVPVRGMHYHYVLDRLVLQTQGAALRARLEQLLALYSPRNLYALAELTLRIESLFAEGVLHRTLTVLLLDCLDHCSSLNALPRRKVRRRGLSRPNRFLERNVWFAFEEAVARFEESTGEPISGLADSLETFQAAPEEWTGTVVQGLVRDLPHSLPSRHIRLILASPPPLDSATWVLSYFWGAWLLGAEAVTPLRPLLRQRTPDPAWYGSVMAGSLRNLAVLLRDDGRLALILTGQRPAVVEALLLGASRARLGLASLVQRGVDYRLEFTPTHAQPARVSSAPLEVEIQRTTTDAATETIRKRGEPVPWRTLHAAIQQTLAAGGLWTRALGADREGPSALDFVGHQVEQGLADPALMQLPGAKGGEGLWWLALPTDMDMPLCDRVEIAAHQALVDTLALTEVDFAKALYPQFPGLLTPEAGLMRTCLRDYAHEVSPGYWQLRIEDMPAAREAEREMIIKDLQSLGQRLGYRSTTSSHFDTVWLETDQMRAVFVVRWRAALSEALALADWIEGARPYLVIPGGRAALVSYKLAHNPIWQQAVDDAGWRFIKYRHVRQLVAQPEVDEYTLRTIVGLDPIVERETVQLSLF